MFGYVIANLDTLTEEQKQRYRACYCGLCRAIGEGAGQFARVALSYDMTFLVLVLSSLYEPETEQGNKRCAVHPLKSRAYFKNSVSAYAADINTALSYYKCLDDYKDEHDLIKRGEAQLLKAQMPRIANTWPRQCGVMERELDTLSRLEAEGFTDADAATNSFGRLMGELFVWREDEWAETLRRMGAALGRFIYLLDAYNDLQSDRRAGRSSPIDELTKEPEFETLLHDILTMMIGECAIELEKLPLVEDMDIIRNIIYSGVWTQYYSARKRHGKENE